jgi:hypothetical protein
MIRILLFLLPTLAFSQQDSTQKIKVVSVNVWGGGNISRGGFEDRTLFQQASPSSSLAFANVTGYGNNSGDFFLGNTYANSIAGISVNVKLAKCKSSEFRIGLAHSRYTISTQSYGKSVSTTLYTTPLPGGGVLTSDSVFNTGYSYEWMTDVLDLQLQWTVRSNPARIFSVYAGGGLYFGMGYNGTIRNSFIESSIIQHTSEGPAYVYYSTDYTLQTDIREEFKAPGLVSFGAEIPVGFNIRLGRRNAFFSHLVYFNEYRGSLQFIKPSGVDMIIRTSSGMIAGLRWYITPPKGQWKKGKGKEDKSESHHHE